MKKIYIYRLLFIIQNRLSIDNLLNMGLDFSQIAIMLSDLFEKGLVVEAEEKGIILTEKGREILEELSHTLFSNNNSKWILPADKFRIEKIGISDVYLPRKKS